MKGKKVFGGFLILFLLVFSGGVSAQDQQSQKILMPPFFVTGNADQNLVSSFRKVLVDDLTQAGFSVGDFDSNSILLSDYRFQVLSDVRLSGDWLTVSLSAFDMKTGKTVVSDFVPVFNGIISLDTVQTAMEKFSQKMKAYREKVDQELLEVYPVKNHFLFLSKDEGATVWWNDHIVLGQIRQGKLEAPYFPYASNGFMALHVEKEGYLPRDVLVNIGSGNFTVKIPALIPVRTQELIFFTSYENAFQLGIGYRRFITPNWLYWTVEALPVQYRGDKVAPAFHLDFDARLGTFVLFPEDSSYRMALQLGLGMRQTINYKEGDDYLADYLFTPIDVLSDFRVGDLIIENEIRVPIALGSSKSNYPTGKAMVLNFGFLPVITLGVVTKW